LKSAALQRSFDTSADRLAGPDFENPSKVAAHENERLPSLDFLRGLAALSVFVPHFFMYERQEVAEFPELMATMAVEVFFVLSGFVLGPQIILCAQQRTWSTLRIFWIRRWMRTIPSYIVALLGVSILSNEIGSNDFFRYCFYVQNLFAQHNTTDYFPVAWSLSVEEWYYVTFPPFLLLIGLLLRSDGFKTYVSAALAFIAIITVIRFLLGDMQDWGASVRRVVVFRIDSIAYGFLLFLVVRQFGFGGGNTSRIISIVALVAATALLGFLNGLIEHGDLHWARHIHPFASAAFGMSALAFFLSFNSWFSGPYMAALSTYLGRISYPAYLFHLVILYALFRSIPNVYSLVPFALYVAAVFGFATFFFYTVERNILAARPRYQK
jgi:peptidoglycan/LPS O-acetylase OafA/YrhL